MGHMGRRKGLKSVNFSGVNFIKCVNFRQNLKVRMVYWKVGIEVYGKNSRNKRFFNECKLCKPTLYIKKKINN